MKLRLPEVKIPERFQRPLQWAGYPLFAVVVFLLSLHASLPRERIQEQILSSTSEALGADIKANDFGLTLIPGVRARGVTVTPRPLQGLPAPVGPDGKPEKPSPWYIDDVTIHFNLLQLMRGFTSTTFHGHAARGSVTGAYSALADKFTLELDVKAVELQAMPSLARLLGLAGVPLEGQVGLKGEIVAPQNMLAQSEGELELTLKDVQLGDGKAKLTVPGNPYLAAGLTVPQVKLGKIVGGSSVAKGRAQLHDVKGHSPDLDIEIEGYVELRDPFGFSQLHLYVKLKPSEALIKREPGLEALVSMAGAAARRPDGYYGIEITGPANGPPMVRPAPIPPLGLNLKPAIATKPPAPPVPPLRPIIPSAVRTEPPQPLPSSPVPVPVPAPVPVPPSQPPPLVEAPTARVAPPPPAPTAGPTMPMLPPPPSSAGSPSSAESPGPTVLPSAPRFSPSAGRPSGTSAAPPGPSDEARNTEPSSDAPRE